MAKKKNNRKGEIKMTNEEIKNEEQVVVTEEIIPTGLNEGEEIVIEDVNANNDEVEQNEEPKVDPENKPADEAEEQDKAQDEIQPEETKEEGVVEGCAKLNVRKEANKTAEVVCVINKGDSVVIDRANSTEDFYKVCVLDFEGYCVKDFIKIK